MNLDMETPKASDTYFGLLTLQFRDLSAAHLRIKNYRNLLFKLESLLNVYILALDNPNSGNHKDIVKPNVNIPSILEMAAQLIPHGEAEFLDVVKERV